MDRMLDFGKQAVDVYCSTPIEMAIAVLITAIIMFATGLVVGRMSK